MLQTICSCGRIAEVRHRKNGKKLAFIHCTSGCGGIVSAIRAAEIEASAKEDIGVKGDIFKTDLKNTSKNVQSKQGSHFKPEAEDLPENLESTSENLEAQIDEPPVKTGNGLKLFFGLLGAALIGGGVYKVSQL